MRNRNFPTLREIATFPSKSVYTLKHKPHSKHRANDRFRKYAFMMNYMTLYLVCRKLIFLENIIFWKFTLMRNRNFRKKICIRSNTNPILNTGPTIDFRKYAFMMNYMTLYLVCRKLIFLENIIF